MEVSGLLHASAALCPGKKPLAPWIGGWVGPRASLDVLEKRKIVYPCQESNSVSAQESFIFFFFPSGLTFLLI
jgi:hypothetical protein